MRPIALKLPEELLEEYIRMAKLRAERLGELSRRVREESMRVNAEFAAIERDANT